MVFLKTTFFSVDKEIHYLWSLIINKKCINQVTDIKPNKHWKGYHVIVKAYILREILTKTWIPLFYVMFCNTLLHLFSVIICLESEHGVFCIWIVDIISISALVVFILLRARNNQYNKGPVFYVLTLYSHYRYIELSILFLFILLWDTPA